VVIILNVRDLVWPKKSPQNRIFLTREKFRREISQMSEKFSHSSLSKHLLLAASIQRVKQK